MSVRKRLIKTKAGTTTRWEASVVLNNGERVRRMFSTKAEAVQVEADIKAKDNVGGFRKKSDQVTLSEHLSEYVDITLNRVKRGEVVSKYHRTIRGHVENYICFTPSAKSERSYQCADLNCGIGHIKLRDLTRLRTH